MTTAGRRFCVVIPVKDGARHLAEVLGAVLAQEGDPEILVIDSGSTDGSLQIARAAGVRLLEIEPESFGHGRTRNLGAQETAGELICFLTQDATPQPGWLAAYERAFDEDLPEGEIGAAFGPHLPRPDSSPMIARELTEFFATFERRDHPEGIGIQRVGQAAFLSNVNACYRRSCWEQIRFRDVPYAEDQAFGEMLLAGGWTKAYVPKAAVMHAHDYPPVQFMRRYFDEYRGLRESTGHVERLAPSTATHVAREVVRDARWMRERGIGGPRLAPWLGRSAVHHAGRSVFSVLGSHAQALPPYVQRRLSLEGTVVQADHDDSPRNRLARLMEAGGAGAGGPKPTRHRPPGQPSPYEAVLEVARDGIVPLLEPVPGLCRAASLHIAVVIPYFNRGSGGHSTIFNVMSRLEERGHTLSVWLHDPYGHHGDQPPSAVRRDIRRFFAPTSAPVFKGFDAWYGADIVLATGWDTVDPVLRLGDCRLRAYFVQDYEPEFFATSAQSLWASMTYDRGLVCIAASRWLADKVREHGATASHFDLGVDRDVYRPRAIARREDTVIFYARDVTPRRAVPLGLLALQELARRRPRTRFVLFGDERPVDTPCPYEHLGVASPEQLAWAYSEASVGLVLSLTNYSLIAQEMLGCGLPCVELSGRSAEGVFGHDGPVTFVDADPVQLAQALANLLDDRERRAALSRRGLDFVAERSWQHAANQVEDGLRAGLRAREQARFDQDAGYVAKTDVAALPTDHNLRTTAADGLRDRPAARALFARLADADVQAVLAALTPEQRAEVDGADAALRLELLLHFGVWHQISGVLERTGLTPDLPPEDVHAMGRGPLAAGGSLYHADLLAELLEEAGRPLSGFERGLDFGCSSGRVTRVLQALAPNVGWHGCDPNGPAVAWASAHIGAIRFTQSPTDPPLAFADDHFDLVVAVSIWSHYGESAARRWLRELERLIRPGGLAILTTHGPQSVAYYGENALRSRDELAQIRRAMHQIGFYFKPEFGESGDWGVLHPEWGTAYISPEWMLRETRAAWRLESFRAGGNEDNQDVFVLERRPPPARRAG